MSAAISEPIVGKGSSSILCKLGDPKAPSASGKRSRKRSTRLQHNTADVQNVVRKLCVRKPLLEQGTNTGQACQGLVGTLWSTNQDNKELWI